eukprot:3367672-Rhodomonas_salina.2
MLPPSPPSPDPLSDHSDCRLPRGEPQKRVVRCAKLLQLRLRRAGRQLWRRGVRPSRGAGTAACRRSGGGRSRRGGCGGRRIGRRGRGRRAPPLPQPAPCPPTRANPRCPPTTLLRPPPAHHQGPKVTRLV